MKSYRGERAPDGGARVCVERGGRCWPLAHHVRYSTADFDYGVLGPRALDLARSILIDHLAEAPRPMVEEAFAWRFIGPLDRRAAWTISEAELAAWLAIIEAQGHPDGP